MQTGKRIFWIANCSLTVGFKDKHRVKAFCVFFFSFLMHAGLFHTRNFAQMEGKTQFKSNSKQVPEDCCQRQNKATGTFLQVSSVQVYLIQRPHCSFFKHTSIQSAHTHTKTPSTHTLQHNVTHTHTHTSYC